MEKTLIADVALLPTGWARDVQLRVGVDGTLREVGAGTHDRATPSGPERIQGIVVPAVPNLHSHAFQRGIVGLTERRTQVGSTGQRDDFWSWREAMYGFVQRLDPEAVEAIATLVYSEMLRGGYGSVVEFHYVHHQPTGQPYDDRLELSRRLVAAATRAGIRMTLVPVVYSAAGFGGQPLSPEQRRFDFPAEDVIEAYNQLNDDSRSATQRFGVGLHSLRAAPPDEVREISAWAEQNPGVPVHIHVAEQPAEVEACREWSGARPIEWLLDNAAVDPRWCLIHATHAEEDERARVARARAVVGLCPTTEANLGDGTFPLGDFEAEGGRWTVGSDSQVSANPAEELRTLEYGQRLKEGTRLVAGRHRRETCSTGRALLEACLGSAASVLGQPVGVLEAGSAADLVVLDPRHPRLAGRTGDSILDSWIFGADASVVDRVMIGGRWVVDGGRPQIWDEAVEGYARAIDRLTQ